MTDATQSMSDLNDKLDSIRSIFYDVFSINPETAPTSELHRRDTLKQSLYYAVNDLKNFADLL